ncbi:MAG: hypothetical protein QGI45_09000, partial [Myxococcota bacterium]|nr:hypothetical protein [Myxococcota bacterium]
DPVILSIVGDGEPNPGPRIVERLLEIMGPYSSANKAALMTQLTYIAGSGIAYETERAGANETDTYSPNKTLEKGTGICRDTHVAVSAIYASYVKAQQSNGVWKPGNPSNCADLAQTVAFFNPDEYHAYMVLKDPNTGKWAALEYGKYYELNAPNALDAFAALPGYIGGYTRYTLRGWDAPPAVNDRGSVGAAMAKDFFREDVGEGERGETRVLAGEHELGLTHFLTPHLALVGRMDPSSATDGNFMGGIKLNYHDDFERVDSRGYIHAAGGLFTHSFEARNSTGISDHSDPTRMSAYRMYVLGFQCDGRWERKAKELLGHKLRLEMGMDWDALLGLPVSTGSEDGTKMQWPSVGDYSTFDVGADIGFSGHHFIHESLRLDYKLLARANLDVINLGTELVTSEGGSARALTQDPWMARGAFGLTHKAENGMLTRFEFGMNQYLGSPFDSETTALGNHYAALSFAPNGDMSFGLIAKGHNTEESFVPVDGLGISFNLTPNDKMRFSLGVEGNAPGGDFSDFGDHINVMGSLSFNF